MNEPEALRLLTIEMDALQAKGYPELAALVDEELIFTRTGADEVEYQIEVQVFPDDPRLPQGDLRILASIDDGTFPAALKPLSLDFIRRPGEGGQGDLSTRGHG